MDFKLVSGRRISFSSRATLLSVAELPEEESANTGSLENQLSCESISPVTRQNSDHFDLLKTVLINTSSIGDITDPISPSEECKLSKSSTNLKVDEVQNPSGIDDLSPLATLNIIVDELDFLNSTTPRKSKNSILIENTESIPDLMMNLKKYKWRPLEKRSKAFYHKELPMDELLDNDHHSGYNLKNNNQKSLLKFSERSKSFIESLTN
ncbi:hypothetical protein HK096_002538, partial [Nowakowskiella sp. JEL0078]